MGLDCKKDEYQRHFAISKTEALEARSSGEITYPDKATMWYH